ncbi:MAG: hypothetical protein AAFY11_06845 [Cyanobacteria bacterium J06641_5]
MTSADSFPRKTPRITTSTELRGVSLADLGMLFVRDGLPPMDPSKLATALEHSLLVVVARQLKSRQLAGFVRLYGDGVFHLCACDLTIDPNLPNRGSLCRLLFDRLDSEIRVRYPRCSLTIFARALDYPHLQALGFSEKGNNVVAMSLPATTAIAQW